MFVSSAGYEDESRSRATGDESETNIEVLRWREDDIMTLIAPGDSIYTRVEGVADGFGKFRFNILYHIVV